MLINLEGEEKKSPVQKKKTNQLNQPPQEFLNKCKTLKPTGYRKKHVYFQTPPATLIACLKT